MNTKHIPASQLPWISKADAASVRIQSAIGAGVAGIAPIAEQDAAYIANAANQYGPLIEALIVARDTLRASQQHDAADRIGYILRAAGEE